ncbi:1-hydroxycarotenoid 3,4-desaturase CrtD [Persicobacter sp. CCB-QB2]|uniref:1-hydroxycarotenoid 3,4-desaturase CrtD n=1 Tax=Persicobacter sp. CCB-QB2 TaxID=1561025 RepID=UPI0006A99BA3|nr:1-hydroxycarotenoid 3,4-desaturase CrtD [Persicobacter sp. CCB-QB2]
MNKIGIIGAGVAGLSVAIRSAIKGEEVHVFEANAYPGGKLSEIKSGEYRFDAGPSLFTLPELVDELFELAGENPRDHFEYSRMDPICKYFYESGLEITAHAEVEKFAGEIAQKTKVPFRQIMKGMKKSQELYETLAPLFMYKSIHKAKTYWSREAFNAYPKVPRLNFLRSMHQENQHLYGNKEIIQLFDRYATYNGSDPYQTPATLNIIQHLEHQLGAYAPKGGMIAITKALFELANRKGVHFHFNQRVEEILTEDKLVKGIATDQGQYKFDAVVSNMDMVNTYRKLLPQAYAPKFLLNQPKSSSALIFYWGIKKQFPQLGVHNILFSKNYREEFRQLFDQKSIFEDPTIYICITSKYEPEDAPKGCENWFTMINVPHNQGQDWDQLVREARAHMIQKINRQLRTNIEELIETEEILDPRGIEDKTSSFAGALYGNSSNNMFAAFLRHANYSSNLQNLFFCGGSVHPGGGIPLSILSGKLAREFMDEKLPA